MNYLYGILMSWGMFTILPCPYRGWKEEARGHMLVAFPVIGVIIGLFWYLLYLVTISLPMYLRCVIIAALPWVITGFIHLDGYMDVCDAILSRRDIEAKRRILKDSRVGAFAVICLSLLMLTQAAAVMSLDESGNGAGLLLIPIASRICASLAVINMKPMGSSQYSEFKRVRTFTVILILMLLAILSVWLFWVRLGIVVTVTCITYFVCALYGNKMLGGMNGDISGYALTIAELAGIIGLII